MKLKQQPDPHQHPKVTTILGDPDPMLKSSSTVSSDPYAPVSKKAPMTAALVKTAALQPLPLRESAIPTSANDETSPAPTSVATAVAPTDDKFKFNPVHICSDPSGPSFEDVVLFKTYDAPSYIEHIVLRYYVQHMFVMLNIILCLPTFLLLNQAEQQLAPNLFCGEQQSIIYFMLDYCSWGGVRIRWIGYPTVHRPVGVVVA